jgi:hypothetical protein
MTLELWGFSGSPSIGMPLRPSGYFLLLGEIALLLAFLFIRQDWAKIRRQVVRHHRCWSFQGSHKV